jgi:hypothetical protein
LKGRVPIQLFPLKDTSQLAARFFIILQGRPIEGIPILSEMVAACLAIITAVGLMRMKSWSLPCGLALAGLWAYGVIAGIQLVMENGLDFTSPFGALTDAILFPLILAFSIYMTIYLWRNRRVFE